MLDNSIEIDSDHCMVKRFTTVITSSYWLTAALLNADWLSEQMTNRTSVILKMNPLHLVQCLDNGHGWQPEHPRRSGR